MSQLQFEITNQVINRVDRFKPVANSKNYLSAHFTFLTDEWSGTITAIFTKNGISYETLLDENNECLVPWELLAGGGDIYVSCFCGDLITATPSRVTVFNSGYTEDGENTEPPTPNIYDQIIAQFDALREDLEIIDGGTFDNWETEE